MSRCHPRRKTGSGRFARLPLIVLGHESVITLTHAAFRVLVILAAQFTGYNNGALALSKTQAAKQNISNRTLYRALRTLERRGLIDRTYPSSRVPPRPTMFALTWLAVDDTEWSNATRVPARTFADWKPQTVPKKTTPRKLLHAVK